MSSKCKPKYKNLNLIQSFSDQRYAVLELFEQACMNEEWLRQQVEKLKYLSPPAMRHRFVYDDDIDSSKSYGWAISGIDEHEIVMSNSTHKTVEITDFNDTNTLIDFNKSDCDFENYTDANNIEHERAVCSPKIAEIEKDYSNSFKNAEGSNSYWYVGYDKSKPYVVNKKWVKNWKHPKIPSVVRAQTFKCKLDEINATHPGVTEAWLKSVTLNIQNTGEMTHEWTSPLYVQIWPTREVFVPKTTWDDKKKRAILKFIPFSGDDPKALKPKSQSTASQIAKGQYQEKYAGYDKYSQYEKKLKYTSGKKKGQFIKDKNGNYVTETAYKKDKNGNYVVLREIIYNPKNNRGGKSTIYNPLAEGKFNPSKTTPNWYTITLDKACKLKKGEHYAIVMFSPLSHPSHCPRIGGYGRNCKKAKYDQGDAFLSEDNGRTFKRYGYNDLELSPAEYKLGRLTPQDFMFELELNYTPDGKYKVNNDSYLYLTPILSNPIKSFKVTGNITGETEHDRSQGLTAQVQYSIEGGNENWQDISLGETKYFVEDNPQCLHLRVLLNTTKANDTACVESLTVDLETDVAKQMYVRTNMFSPPSSLILGPHMWGRVFAPFEVTPNSQNIDATVEVIEKRLVTEHIDIIEVSDLDDYIGLTDNDGKELLDSSKIIDVSDDDRAQYLIDSPSIIKRFKENMPNKSVYIKPYTLNDVTYYMSFEGTDNNGDKTYDGSIQLKSSPAYPIIESNFVPANNSAPFVLGEWYDYTIDYDKDILILDEAVLEDLSTGSIQLNYNPIFIQGLINEEVGVRVDEETGLIEEGLILDYFKQYFIVNQSNVETRSIDLKAIPLNPLREVILNKDKDNEKELYEDIDFTVDYENKRIIFPIKEDSTQASILNVNDTVDVVYTPELRADGLMIGYWVKRSSSEYNVKIKSSYLEYK